MFGLLDALRTSMTAGVNMAGADRLVLRNKVGLTEPLPLAYYEKIKAVQGVVARSRPELVRRGSPQRQNPKEQIRAVRDAAGAIPEVYPEVEDSRPRKPQAWHAGSAGHRRRAGAGAETFGWKKGDRIPIRSRSCARPTARTPGSSTSSPSTRRISRWLDGRAYMNFDYYNESLQFGKDTIGSDGHPRARSRAESDAIAQAASTRMFANSADETKTATERDCIKHFMDADRRHRHDRHLGDAGGVLHHAAGHRQPHGAIGARTHQ